MSSWFIPVFLIIGILIGMVAGWIFATFYYKKQVSENPPITESQIRSIYKQSGRTLSEKQLAQIMNSFKKK